MFWNFGAAGFLGWRGILNVKICADSMLPFLEHERFVKKSNFIKIEKHLESLQAHFVEQCFATGIQNPPILRHITLVKIFLEAAKREIANLNGM